MKISRYIPILLVVLLFPCVASAGVVMNGIKISDDGKIIFLDKSTQGTATLKGDRGDKGDLGDRGNQGDKGDRGDKGDKGDPGVVDKAAICQVYADDNLPAPPFCGKKIIFVTSQGFNGAFGLGDMALPNADFKCQSAATAGGLSGTFKAWLSTNSISAKDRITHSPAPYVRTDGTIVALHWLDLTDGWLKDPIICDEYRNCSPEPATVYTGTSRLGTTTGGGCLDWQSSESSRPCSGGSTGEINSNWTEGNGCNCNLSYHKLYCIEQ